MRAWILTLVLCAATAGCTTDEPDTLEIKNHGATSRGVRRSLVSGNEVVFEEDVTLAPGGARVWDVGKRSGAHVIRVTNATGSSHHPVNLEGIRDRILVSVTVDDRIVVIQAAPH